MSRYGGLVKVVSQTDGVIALKANGELLSWGDPTGEADAPLRSPLRAMDVAAVEYGGYIVYEGGSMGYWGAQWEPMRSGFAEIAAAPATAIAVEGGGDGAIVLLDDGSAIPVGTAATSNPPNPAELTDVTKAAGNYNGYLALRGDGTVVYWGDFKDSHPIPVEAQSGVIDVACTYHACLVLKADGTVVAWGRTTQSVTTVPPQVQGNTVALIGGNTHTPRAVQADGSHVTWGGSAPAWPSGKDHNDFVQVSPGDAHVVGLQSNGVVEVWGSNGSWQISNMPAELSAPITTYLADANISNLPDTATQLIVRAGVDGGTLPAGSYIDTLPVAAGSTGAVTLDLARVREPLTPTSKLWFDLIPAGADGGYEGKRTIGPYTLGDIGVEG